jgi:hypothetical protein
MVDPRTGKPIIPKEQLEKQTRGLWLSESASQEEVEQKIADSQLPEEIKQAMLEALR